MIARSFVVEFSLGFFLSKSRFLNFFSFVSSRWRVSFFFCVCSFQERFDDHWKV